MRRLSADERAEYLRAREELAEALLLAQESVPTGHPAAHCGWPRPAVEIQGPAAGCWRSPWTSARAASTCPRPRAGTRSASGCAWGGVRAGHRVRPGVNAVPLEEMAASDRERLEFIVDAVLKQFGH